MDHETTALARLAEAIGYPAEIPAGARVFTLLVDGAEIDAEVERGRLRLSWRFPAPREEGDLARLAGYAAGRMLKEEAVLAWDPAAEAALLWQDVPVAADGPLLRRFFEVFTASRDWWAARVEGDPVLARVPEMMILP